MKKIINITIFLTVICIISASAMYFSNSITAPIIAKNKKENTERMLKALLPKADSFKQEVIEEGSIANRYIASSKDQTIAYVYEVTTFGFQSQIVVLVVIDPDGNYAGFQVVEQAETPGYGTQIETSKRYRKQFTSKSVNDELDTIAGSTVTTKSLNAAILEAANHFIANNK